MPELMLILLVAAGTVAGYRIIGKVPSLLHTPLMSGMNALSGIALLGALAATASASVPAGRWLGGCAVTLATINVVGGFLVTHRMLRMFKSDSPELGGSGEQ